MFPVWHHDAFCERHRREVHSEHSFSSGWPGKGVSQHSLVSPRVHCGGLPVRISGARRALGLNDGLGEGGIGGKGAGELDFEGVAEEEVLCEGEAEGVGEGDWHFHTTKSLKVRPHDASSIRD